MLYNICNIYSTYVIVVIYSCSQLPLLRDGADWRAKSHSIG